MEHEGSRCLRREQNNEGDRNFDMLHAKEECSKNERCVGIESSIDASGRCFKLCLDSIYRITPLDKYQHMNDRVFKKSESRGMYRADNAT